MGGIAKGLEPHSTIGLDTSVFIYHIEDHPRYRGLTLEVLDSVEDGRRSGVTSVVTLMELTVYPWREGRPAVAREYEALLVHFPNLLVADVTRDVARLAARLRARYRVRPADALQLATALQNGASAFVTNDRRIARLAPAIDVLVLDDYASP